MVATVRALKMHGGVLKSDLGRENLVALENGLPNLLRHVKNIKEVYGLPCVVAINRFPTDTDKEVELVKEKCLALGVDTLMSDVWAKGGEGALELADKVVELADTKSNFTLSYPNEYKLADKIGAVVTKVYGGVGVKFEKTAQEKMDNLEKLGFGHLPVCIAKTQYSFSDDPTLLGAPDGFTVTVRDIKVSAGAGFVVALTGAIMTMPGLPKVPSALKIDVDDETGKIIGLF